VTLGVEPVRPDLRTDPVDRALDDMAGGRPVVVVDAVDRENEADLIFAATHATPELVGFMVRHTSGVVCVPMPAERLEHLGIPPMTTQNRESMRTAFHVSVDAAQGITTGISAADRARTIRILADDASNGTDLVQPGHVFPLRYRTGGVLTRPGHTEAAVDLARLAGCPPIGVLAELVDDDGMPQRGPQARAFADRHGLALVSIADLIRYRRRSEHLVERVSRARLPTPHGEFEAVGYRCTVDGSEHVALVKGDPGARGGSPPVVRVHSECLTGEAFRSLRCDCGPQLDHALAKVGRCAAGVVVYVRGHEGRGIGLLSKLAAYELQDAGHDTVDANVALGLPVDGRDYWIAAQILADLGVDKVQLLSNNPAKADGLQSYGIGVSATVPLTVAPNPENVRYLRAKRERLGHLLPADHGDVRIDQLSLDELEAGES
jgi:3,4-dihydroxy 2-butanone 4-phosphate synthase/GTP cyclohydrolase II